MEKTNLYNLIVWDFMGNYKALEIGKTLEQCKARRNWEIEHLGRERWFIHSYEIVPYTLTSTERRK